ncbi:MAG: bifunctional diaminohydroxyphosphoribosylaminopyrimidine deaminase/5-amino-6-(5-phosphoribosylamino)uracil reductase RibD, partial [Eggerthellaceae bacterium]|nr:bifunctional diaminohydroxyphosphoribosylaminopyrimidine deaminase/5-amino-6-(5-phosphoribosylamino)uracil reductase RibD [Eggerthellaceae bacterium]
MEIDESKMLRAIELAALGAGWTNPNPLVGAVVVKGGRIVGEGYHECYGEAHAERNALADCARRGESPRGATLYVTLEPCCHQGKQPPCTDALIEADIARVVVGSRDPNPLVAGRGNTLLRKAGIEVVEDVLRAECDELNPIFFHYIQTKRPFVVAKWAMTLDGKIATRT